MPRRTRPERYFYRVVFRYENGCAGPVEVVMWSGESKGLAEAYWNETRPDGLGISARLERVPHSAWETIQTMTFDDFIDRLRNPPRLAPAVHRTTAGGGACASE